FARYIAAIGLPQNVTTVLFPPVVYLDALARALQGCPIQLGGQNGHGEAAGAFTGEIAPEMIRDLGAQWMLVGHSERREYFGETDSLVAEKFAGALRAGLNPILCVGETLAQRDAGQAEAVVCAQVRAVASRVGAEAFSKVTLAYEPIWAIGTGQTATPDQAQAMHAVIRAEIDSLDGPVAEQVRVLYGGSMNPENAEMLLGERDIDGGLIGGASLGAESFSSIIATVSTLAAADQI
ncbi:MAG: triose-phosphate isomerase, partial [Gammaproteobacteria bacterium]|nr:triose-phosphate isomerase [Gammaproteobacteria bacterium]